MLRRTKHKRRRRDEESSHGLLLCLLYTISPGIISSNSRITKKRIRCPVMLVDNSVVDLCSPSSYPYVWQKEDVVDGVVVVWWGFIGVLGIWRKRRGKAEQHNKDSNNNNNSNATSRMSTYTPVQASSVPSSHVCICTRISYIGGCHEQRRRQHTTTTRDQVHIPHSRRGVQEYNGHMDHKLGAIEN